MLRGGVKSQPGVVEVQVKVCGDVVEGWKWCMAEVERRYGRVSKRERKRER